MKKLALVLMAVAALGSLSFAQKGAMAIGGDVGLFLPMGDAGDVYSMGFGVLPNFSYMMSENLALTGTVGYISWGAKEEIAGWDYSLSDIPIKAGVKYFFGQGKMKPFVIGEAGLHMISATVKGTILGYSFDESASETDFGFAAGGGIMMPMGEKMDLNLCGEYESIMTEGESTNNLAIRAGLVFKLK